MVFEYGINLRLSKGYGTALCLYSRRVRDLCSALVCATEKYCRINFWSSAQREPWALLFLAISHWKQHVTGSLSFSLISKEQAEIYEQVQGNTTTCISLSLFSIPATASDSLSDSSFLPRDYSVCVSFALVPTGDQYHLEHCHKP